MKKTLVLVFLLFTAAIAQAQTTVVSGTITDTNSTPYANGQLSISLLNNSNQQPLFQGSAQFTTQYRASLDVNGSFSITIPDNSFITPYVAGNASLSTQWTFTYQSVGNHGAASANITITGASQSVTSPLSGLVRISWPSGTPAPPGLSNQVITSIGSGLSAWGTGSAGATPAFSSITAGTNASALVVGTGGSLTTSGSGTINATTLGGATFANPGTIGTTPGAGHFTTLDATSTISAISDGVHSGYTNWIGNTANQAVTANTAGFMGPNLASFTGYGLQLPSTGPTTALSFLNCATPASSVSACSFTNQFPVGTACSAPGFSIGVSNTGFATEGAGNLLGICVAGTFVATFVGTSPTGLVLKSNAGLIWATNVADGADDTGLSRGAAGILNVDGATVGAGLGTIRPGAYATTANCSSSASPAVCAAAAAGNAALPTNAVSSSIVVNTTAVTANSQIFAMTDDTLGTKLSVTCNSTVATLVGGLTISARTAGVSFTVANNVAVAVNPLCISWFIVN